MESFNSAIAPGGKKPGCKPYDPTDPANSQKDLPVQLVLSLSLGVSAFVGFCVGGLYSSSSQ